MPNIQLNYLYRDAGNYKKFGCAVFSNCLALPLNAIREVVTYHLIDGEWFYAHKWQLPALHFDNWLEDADHGFHEFESLNLTSDNPTILPDISDWLKYVS